LKTKEECVECKFESYNTWWDFDVIERTLILHNTDGSCVALLKVKKEDARAIQEVLDETGGVKYEG